MDQRPQDQPGDAVHEPTEDQEPTHADGHADAGTGDSGLPDHDAVDDYDWGQPYEPDETDEPGHNVPRPRARTIRTAVQASQQRSSTKRKYKASGGPQKANTRILAQQKRRTVVEMRKAGASFPAIAQAVGYKDEGGAYKAYRRAMGEVIQEPVAELKVLQLERLNHMLVAIWQRVQTGDISAMNMALSIMNKMDALQGTEAAHRVEVKNDSAVLVIDGNKDDYIAALKKMSGAGVQPDGTNQGAPALPAPGAPVTTRYPPGMGPATTHVVERTDVDEVADIVDAIVVDEDSYLADQMSAMGAALDGAPKDEALEQRIKDITQPPAPAVPTKKKHSWGMDPTAKPRPKDQR